MYRIGIGTFIHLIITRGILILFIDIEITFKSP